MEFVQERIATLHALTDPDPPVPLDRVAVVVPITGTDLDRASVQHVLSTLATIDPGRVILAIRAERDRVRSLRDRLASDSLDADVLWCNAPRLEETLADAGIAAAAGKGRDVWLGMGVAATSHEIIVVHDADSRTYSHRHVPRLAWPIDQGFTFSKGYYARIEGQRFFGRLVRLVWFPLMDVLDRNYTHPLIDYLSSFRYPLAGEFAVSADRVADLRIYPEWGLETGMLGAMYEQAGIDGTAQVDLGMHRHAHRPIRGESGLVRMARAVVGALFDILDRHGVGLSGTDIAPAYERTARQYVDRYATDAAFNGISYDRGDELDQIASYRDAVVDTGTSPDPLPPFARTTLDPIDVLDRGEVDTRRIP